jgi:hypothetical protein
MDSTLSILLETEQGGQIDARASAKKKSSSPMENLSVCERGSWHEDGMKWCDGLISFARA